MPPRPSPIVLAEAGAREAAYAMAALLKRPKSAVAVKGVTEVDSGELVGRHSAAPGGPRCLVVAFTVSGAMPGRFAVITGEATARAFAVDLIGPAKAAAATASSTDALGLPKRWMGALTELGNIAVSSYLNGVASLIANATCVPSVPKCTFDDAAKAIPGAFGGPRSLVVASLQLEQHAIDLAFAG